MVRARAQQLYMLLLLLYILPTDGGRMVSGSICCQSRNTKRVRDLHTSFRGVNGDCVKMADPIHRCGLT